MSNNPKLQDMGEHAKQLLGLIQECKPDAGLFLLFKMLQQWKRGGENDYLLVTDGVVYDYKTGLMWKQKCELNKYSYYEAIEQFKKSTSFAGYNDWRLPTIDELKTILQTDLPHINKAAFPNNPSHIWSVSPDTNFSNRAWYVHFTSGNAYSFSCYKIYNVRLVRGGK